MLYNTVEPTPYRRPTTDLKKVCAAVYNHKQGKRYSREAIHTFVLNDREHLNLVPTKDDLVNILVFDTASLIPECESPFVQAMTMRDLVENPVRRYTEKGEIIYEPLDPEEDYKSKQIYTYYLTLRLGDDPKWGTIVKQAFPEYFEEIL